MTLGSIREVAALVVTATETATPVLNKVAAGVAGVQAATKQASLQSFGYSHAFSELGKAFTAYGAAAVGASVAAGKWAIDFESGMALVRTQVDLSNAAFARLEDRTLEVASTTSRSTDEITEGLYDVFSSLDVNAREGVKMIELFAQAAVAGNTDIRTATRGTVAMLNAYGLEAEKTNEILDLQFNLVRFGVGEYTEFASTIGMVLPSARAANQELDTLAGSLAYATRAGLSAAEAGTAVGRALDLISRPDTRTDMLKVLGVDVLDKATGDFKQMDEIITDMATTGGLAKLNNFERKKVLEKIFGQGEIRANRFFNTAIPNFKELDSLTRRVGDSAGAMQSAYDKMAKTFGVQWGIFINRLKTIGIEIANRVLPHVITFVKWLGSLLDRFDDLSPTVQKFIAYFIPISGILSLVAGAVFMLAGRILFLKSILEFTGVSFKFFAAASLGTVAAIAGLAVAGYLLIKNWDKVTAWWKRNWNTIKTVASAVIPFLTVLIGVKLVAAFTAMRTAAIAAAGAQNAGGIIGALSGIKFWALNAGRELTRASLGTISWTTAISRIISPTVAWAGAIGLVVAAAFAVHQQLARLNDQAAAYAKTAIKQGDSIAEMEQSMIDLGNTTTGVGGAILGIWDSISSFWSNATMNRAIEEVRNTWARWAGTMGASSEDLEIFNELMHRAEDLTRKESKAILAKIDNLSNMNVKLTKSERMMIANLAASGDYEAIMDILNGTLDRTLRGFENLNPEVRENMDAHIQAAKAAHNQAIREGQLKGQLDKVTGALKNLNPEVRENMDMHIRAALAARAQFEAERLLNNELIRGANIRPGAGASGRSGGGGNNPGGGGGGGNGGGNGGFTPGTASVTIQNLNVNRKDEDAVIRELDWALRTSI